MGSYDTAPWQDLFVMTGGAAAALAGLILVAVSLNHEAILQIAALSALAARTLTVLIGVVVLCLAGLAPGQPTTMLGAEVIAGVSLVASVGGGLYWLLVEFATAIVIATHSAWILLIEIRR